MIPHFNKGKAQRPAVSYVEVRMECSDGEPSGSQKVLRDAVSRKDYQECKKQIEEGADVKFKHKDGSTLLHILAEKYSKKEARAQNIPFLLLQNGAIVNDKDKNGDTPLHIAAREGLRNLCTILLDHQKINGRSTDKLINMKNNKSMTPLHFAAQRGELETLNLLIEEGADTNIKDHQKYLPLHHAAERGYSECCKVLISFYPSDAVRAVDEISPVILAAKKGHYRCYQEMVHANINLDLKDVAGNTALHIAAKLGFEKFVTLLCDTLAPLNTQNNAGNTPIMEAVIKNKANCVNVLINSHAALSIKNKAKSHVLHLAAAKKADECMEYLLKNEGVKKVINEKDKDGNTALFIAVKKRNEKCAVLLMNAGASPKIVCQQKLSLLHLAAENAKIILTEKLLTVQDLDVNVTNKDKETPLHHAARGGSSEICHMLLRKGAYINAKDKNGRTALHMSAYQGHCSIVRLLIKQGADKRAKDDTNSTALHAAAAKGNQVCCEILIDANKTLYKEQDKKKRYPLDVAFLKGHDDVFKFLLQILPYRNISTMPKDLQEHLHSHTHKAVKDRNRTVLEAIVESQWWEAGFGAAKKHEDIPCDNFRELIKLYPFLALKVMDNCTKLSCTTPKFTLYDFRIFEDNYFIKGKTCPFDKRWKVDPSADELTLDALKWKNEHPVSIMAKHKCLLLLQHPLTEAWLNYKWRSYAQFLFIGLFLLRLSSVIILICFMMTVQNWSQIELECNKTKEMFCEEFKERASVVCKNPDSSNNSGLHNKTYEWKTAPSYTCHAFLLISLFLQVFFEINRAKKLQWHYLHSNFIFVRLPSLVLTTIVVIPTCSCEFLLGIKMVPIWQCGILALLLTWTQLLQIVNKLPQFTLFTITTWDFIKYYFKGLIYIIMVILLFGLIFHMLLHNQSAFSTMPQSVVKTVVWMLGDLAYDDTFVSGKPPYPILVNVLFLVFICTVAAFIVILLKAPSSNENEATLYKKAGQVNFLLNLDVYFPFLKRKYAVGKYNSKDAKPWIITKMKYVLKPKESLIASKLSEHLDNAALMNINKYRDNNKHYIQLKIEELFNLFNDYADEGENFLLPDPQQDHLNTHTKKLDQLLTLCQQLNENYQKQNEQLLELKQQLDNMKQGSRNRLY